MNQEVHYSAASLWATRLQISWLVFTVVYLAFFELCTSDCCKEAWIKSLFLTAGFGLLLALLYHRLAFINTNYSGTLLLLPLTISVFFGYDSFIKTSHYIGGAFYVFFAILLTIMAWLPPNRELVRRISWTTVLVLIVAIVFSISQLSMEFFLQFLFRGGTCLCVLDQGRGYFEIRPQAPGIVSGMMAFLIIATEKIKGVRSGFSKLAMKWHGAVITLLIPVMLFVSYLFVKETVGDELASLYVSIPIVVKTLLVLLSISVWLRLERNLRNLQMLVKAICRLISSVLVVGVCSAIIHQAKLQVTDATLAEWFVIESVIAASLVVSSILAYVFFKYFCNAVRNQTTVYHG